eukprot:9209641-Pyramimonas_sp.AAC.1
MSCLKHSKPSSGSPSNCRGEIWSRPAPLAALKLRRRDFRPSRAKPGISSPMSAGRASGSLKDFTSQHAPHS